MDSLDVLPDHLLLHILNHVSSQDAKSVVRCSAVSRRLRLLVPLVPSVLIHVHSYFFEDPALFSAFSKFKSRPWSFCRLHPRSLVIRELLSRLLLVLHPHHLGSFYPNSDVTPLSSLHVVHRIPQHVIKNFPCLRALHVVFPVGELCLGDDDSHSILFCWRAHFGSSFKRCLILAAAAVTSSSSPRTGSAFAITSDKDYIIDSLRDSLCNICTRSTVLAASERLNILRPMIAEHRTLESLVITDADGQGVLFMDRDQLVELRKESTKWIRSMKVRMWEWFAPVVELSSGVVLKGAMVVAVLPVPTSNDKEEEMGLGWVEEEFGEGMHAEVVRMLVKGRNHRYREMNCLSLN